MREIPILFSAPMVRALLDGRKTQTRRVVKPVRGFPHFDICRPDMAADDFAVWWHGQETERVGAWQSCPYGEPGDRLWVRETWAQPVPLDPGPTFYRADYPACVPAEYENVPTADAIRWKPSIHMPRWASRILLEITDVRVERLQDISEVDAEAEGVSAGDWEYENGEGTESAKESFQRLWDSLKPPAAHALYANPWVWVVEFKRVTA